MKLYVVKDNVVGKYMNPFLMNNDAEAERAFKQAVNSGVDAPIVRNYKDMALYGLGDYNESTGEITSNVYFVTNGVSVKIIEGENV